VARSTDSPALVPPPGNPRFEALNGLRGLIALGVLVAHATAASWEKEWWGSYTFALGMGVFVFFGLSGFLLYRPYVSARAEGRPVPRLRDYVRRRAVRILPAYWVALTLLAIWPGVPGVFSHHWWVYYGFLQIYSRDWLAGGLPQIWTLCIDVSFYAVLPIYAWAMGRVWARRASLRVEGVAVGAIIVGAFVVRGAAGADLLPAVIAGTLPGFMVFFGLGMALAVLSVALSSGAIADATTTRIRRFAGFGLLAAVPVYLIEGSLFGVPFGDAKRWNLPLLGKAAGAFGSALAEVAHQATLFVFIACLLLPLVSGEAKVVGRRLLDSPSLVGLGVVSYGLYLYHVPVLGQLEDYAKANQIDYFGHPIAGTVVFALSISVPLAMTSYRYVELPFLRWKGGRRRDRPSVPPPAPAPARGASVAAPAPVEVTAR
jgi:peptidoglycan/LPS O-acetylase OafA/YrhL